MRGTIQDTMLRKRTMLESGRQIPRKQHMSASEIVLSGDSCDTSGRWTNCLVQKVLMRSEASRRR